MFDYVLLCLGLMVGQWVVVEDQDSLLKRSGIYECRE